MIKKLLLLSLAASSLLATNGVNMIGTGTVSRSMGGTGVAFFSDGSGAIGKNPALMAEVKSSELHIDVTYFNASVSTSSVDNMFLNTSAANPIYPATYNPNGTSENHLDTNFIPTMSYVTKYNDKWAFGFSMMGAAGMGVDYNGEANNAQRRMKSGMMLMKMIPAASYRMDHTTFGFAPVLGLGSMSINYDEAQTQADGTRNTNQSIHGGGNKSGLFGETNIGGPSLVPALGYQMGVDIKVTDKLRMGATYQSSLTYKYKEVANFKQFGPHGMVNMTNDFTGGALQSLRGETAQGTPGNTKVIDAIVAAGATQAQAEAIVNLMPTGLIGSSLDATDPSKLDDLTMEQPWEIAYGVGYDVTDNVTVTADYRYIAWGLAEGYKDFGWENQSVYALGFEFRPNKQFSFRGGYNYADSPIKNKSGEIGSLLTDIQGTLVFDQAVSMLNMTGFPAIATTHFTLGAGYDFTDSLTLDGAFMYSPETETTRSGALVPGASDAAGSVLPGYISGIHIPALDMDYEYSTKMTQMTLSLGLNYAF